MTDQDGIKLVFTGSSIDANYIKGLLEESNIECMIRDVLNESTLAGWGAGSPENSCHIFVTEEDFDASVLIIDEYLKSEGKLPDEGL